MLEKIIAQKIETCNDCGTEIQEGEFCYSDDFENDTVVCRDCFEVNQ